MEREDIKITQRDAEMIIDLIDNPRQPNEALVKAFERYKSQVREVTGSFDIKGN